MSKRLYMGFSFLEFIRTLLLRLAATATLIFSVIHIKENPVVIAIISFLSLLAILFLGEDQIIVYSDKVIQKTNSFASLIFNSKDITLEIKNIKSAYLEQANSNAKEIIPIVWLAFILPKQNINQSTSIFFNLKNGKTIAIETYLEENKMKKIVDIVNSLTNNDGH